MSASASKPPETTDADRQIGPEHPPTPSDREPKPTNVGNLGGMLGQISDATRLSSEQASKEYDARMARRQEESDYRLRQQLWSNAKVPKLHQSLPNFTPAQQTHGGRMLDSFGTGAIWALLGEWGTGKTQMAAWMIRVACNNLRSALFTTAIEFFVRLRSPFREGSAHRDEAGVIDYFTKFDLLVIDDAHVRADSDFENRLLHHVIDKRHGAMRVTILTSNQSESVFIDTIGGAVVDRMCAAGGIIECDWQSFRGKESDE